MKKLENNPHISSHLVNELVMKEAMNPVDAHVSKKQEGDHTQEEPRPAWKHTDRVTTMTPHFVRSGRQQQQQDNRATESW